MNNIEYRLTLLQDKQSYDLTKYLQAPIVIDEKLNEELNTGKITLAMIDGKTKAMLRPKSKLRIDRYIDGEKAKTWDYCIQEFGTSELIGLEDRYNVEINIIEPSVIAQGMHADNIALTYLLKDINLNYKYIPDAITTIGDIGNFLANSYLPQPPLAKAPVFSIGVQQNRVTSVDTFTNFGYKWENLEDVKSKVAYLDCSIRNTVSFAVPKLQMYYPSSVGAWDAANYAGRITTITTVVESLCEKNGDVVGSKGIGSNVISGDNTFTVQGNNSVQVSDKLISISTPRTVNYSEAKQSHRDVAIQWDPGISITAAPNSSIETITFTTSIMDAADIAKGRYYTYDVKTVPYYEAGTTLVGSYATNTKLHVTSETATSIVFTVRKESDNLISLEQDLVKFTTSFTAYDTSQSLEGGFIKSSAKYNALDFMQKAIRTCGLYFVAMNNRFENTTSIESVVTQFEIEPYSQSLLSSTTINETAIQQKNLYEIMIQMGYYIHAIPKITFSDDGDKLILEYRKLGKLEPSSIEGKKLNIYNSNDIANYVTAFDAYVYGLMSGDQVITETLLPKTTDSSYVITNDTAQIVTSKPIYQIFLLEVLNTKLSSEWKNITEYVFESSIYDILTSDNPTKVRPAKGNSIFYKLASNVIDGLSYVAPAINTGDFFSSFSYIMQNAYGLSGSVIQNIYVNDCIFRVRYKTTDSLRYTAIRPDIGEFLKNSTIEKFPLTEQFFGQQDKLLDSQRLGLYLNGQLVRVGNDKIQIDKFCYRQEQESEPGDLVYIDNAPYYVTSVTNELYKDSTTQKVSLSKNYNQLSNIVTIPSEPRFYEIVTQNVLKREIRAIEIATISTKAQTRDSTTLVKRLGSIMGALLNYSNGDYSNEFGRYVYLRFSDDKFKAKTNANGQVIPYMQLFPSSELVRVDANNLVPENAKSYSEVVVPCLIYSIGNSLVIEFDLQDNFSAGDYVDDGVTNLATAGSARRALQAKRYVDVFGRADIVQWYLLRTNGPGGDTDIDVVKNYPNVTTNSIKDSLMYCSIGTGANYAQVIEKDNREALGFNFQLSFTAAPGFVIGWYLTNINKEKTILAGLCVTPITGVQLTVKVPQLINKYIAFTQNNQDTQTTITFDIPKDIDYESIVLYEKDTGNILIARNISSKDPDCGAPWIIS